MAKVVKKDSDTYLKEKESFLRELQHFHETRGTPCRHSPKIGGKEIDLYLLYCLVTSNGGWVKVNSRNQWNSLLKEFHLPKNCVNVSVALKQIYLRYLDKYEKAHYLGETHNTLEDDEDTTGGGRHKRWSSARSTQPSVPLAYNHSQHQITESVRATSALSKDLYTPSEYDRLALSLLCPLPNEQDFALNVCTLLSNEFRAAQGTPTGIRLGRHTRLLRYLLAHAGVFADDTLRAYYADNYRDVRRHSLEAFWEDAIQDRAVLRLVRDMAAESDERAQQKRSRAREKRRREMEETSDASAPSEREENDVKDELVGSVAAASSSREGNVKDDVKDKPMGSVAASSREENVKDEPVGSVAGSSTKKEDVKASDVGKDGTIEPGKDGMLEPSKKEEEKSDVSDKDDGRPTDSSEEVDKTLGGGNKAEDKQDASSDKESTAAKKEVKSSTAANEEVKSSTATSEVVKSSTATDKEVKSDADAAPCKSPKEQSAAKTSPGGDTDVQSSGSKDVQSSGSKEVSGGASKEEEATAMDVCEGGSKEDDSNKRKSESSSMDVCEESSKEETTRLDDAASKGGKSESSPMEVCCEGSSKEEKACKDASKALEVSTACVQRSEKSSKDTVCEGPSKEQDASKASEVSTACVQRSEKSSKDDLCEGPSKEQSKDACEVPSKEQSKDASSEEEEEGVGKVSDDEVEFLSDSEDLGLRGAKRLKLRLEPEDRALFALGRGLGTQEWVGQRVLQIATLLRNFTFNEENNALLSRDPTFLRFMVLCCSSNWAGLRQLGLDMFSNVALEIRLDSGAAGLAPLLLDIVSRGLASEDRASVLACVEILSRLGQAERNEEVLLRSLQQNVYNQVCTLLTLHDIMLLIHTLECVYSLSSLGERACNAIMRVHGAMDVLVSLVTVEAQSFGPKACILMRVVETVDPNPASTEEDDTPADAPPLPPPGPPTGLNAPAFSMPMALAPVAVPVPLSQAVPPPAHGSPSPMTPMRHRPPLGATPTRVPVAQTSGGPQGTPRPMYRVMTPNKIHTTAAGTSASPVAAPGTSSGTAGAPVVAAGSRPLEENGEMFATQWLRANFEHASLPGRAIEQAELYKQYINAASRAGRRGVIAPLHFPRVVRSVFGAQIGPKQVIPAAPPGSTAPPPPPIHVYEGIQVRGKQPIITQTIAIAAPPSHQQQHQHLAQKQQQHLVQQQNLQQQQQQLVQQQQNLVHQQQQNIAQQQQNQQNLTQQQQQSQQILAQQQQQNLAQQHQNQQMLSQKQQQQNLSQQQQQNLSQQQQSLLSHQQHSQQQTTFLQNPMSPILKAQLSAPPKPQGGGGGGSAVAPGGQSAPPAPTPGCSNTARTKAHPHLSQALLGAGTSTSSNTTHLAPSTSLGGASTSTGDPTCTSLIKSLLANKVGPSESLVASSSSSSCVSSSTTQLLGVVNTAVASQVTQRQQQAQKMLSQAQAGSVSSPSTLSPSTNVSAPGTVPGTGSVSAPGVVRSPGPVLQQQQQMRLNGVTVNMQQVANHVIENSLESKAVSEGGAGDPPSSGNTPPLASQPPPLAPLSSKGEDGGAPAPPGLVDGTSVVVNGGISNSINVLADTSDQQYKENIAKQSLMLVDLLEKSIGDKDTPILNGAVRIGEKGLDLFTSIETKSKLAAAQGLCPAQGALNTPNNTPTTPSNTAPTSTPSNNGGAPPTHVHSSSSSSGGVIRRVSSELESQQHRANGTSAPPATGLLLNGAEQQVSTGLKRPRSQDPQDSSEAPAMKKVHVNGDVNPACINLEEEQEENNVKASSTAANLYAALAADVLEDEELITEPPAPTGVQVTASQAHSTGVQQTPGAPSQAPQGVLSGGPPSQQSQGAQSQNIIMTGGGGGANGRQILVTGGQGGSLPQRLSMMGQHYVVTQQPQLVQGHPGQTVLVAQTGQQGGAGSKTIIILQPSSSSSSSSSPHSSTSSSKPSVTSIAPSSSSTYTSTSHQKVITSAAHPTSVLHRASSIRPQTSATVIKPVPDNTRPRSSLAQPSGFQAQFIQQTQQQQQQQQGKLSQQQAQQQQPVQQPPPPQQQQQQPPAGQFICEWRGCMRNFKSANEVYMHACQSHCPVTPAAEIQCLWERCDVLRRKRFSHMTHLYDRHCNPDVLKMMAVRRKQLTSSGKTEIPPPPSPSPHPGYAPNAALNAIKRHALEFVNPKELQDDNEGPVTKSIRLTSSLILRNLVIYSNTGRRHLVSYEPHLASVALSNVESSKTIAQVLFDMNDTQSRR